MPSPPESIWSARSDVCQDSPDRQGGFKFASFRPNARTHRPLHVAPSCPETDDTRSSLEAGEVRCIGGSGMRDPVFDRHDVSRAGLSAARPPASAWHPG